MMNGKNISFIAGLFIIGLALGSSHKKKFVQQSVHANKITVDQYLNRLSEFFLDDISCAKNDFFELLDMGLNPSDCFEITIAKSSLV
jgi:hypothetical protein